MSIPGSASSLFFQTAGAAAAFALEKSVRFNKADSAYLNRTMSGGDRGKATISCWLKKCNLHSVTGEYIYLMGISSECAVYITTSDRLHFDFYHTDGSTWAVLGDSDMLFRDASAWYHIVLSIDSSAGTSNADRVKLYVNGTQKTFTFTTFGSGTITGDIKHLNQSGQTFQINSRSGQSYYGNFYLANYHYIDGQALDPTDFGAYDDNGVWQAIDASGLTFGTNGFHLFDFANESGIGNDSSGNDNDFTVNNISSTAGAGNDVLRDVPTNGTQSDTGAGGEVSGNYCTFNPLYELTGGYDIALSNGNLEATNGGDAPGTMAFGSGKKYFELTVQSASSFSQGYFGIVNIADHIRPRSWATSQIAALRDSGSLYGDGSTGSAPAATQVGDVYGFAVDVDNQKLFISVNGTYLNSANPVSGTGASFTGRDFSNYAPLASMTAGNGQTIVLNTGQRAFNTAAPTGFQALCTTNLPTPTVADGSTAFDVKTFTANNGSQSLSLGFSPDIVWTKSRANAYEHQIFDTVRGNNQELVTNSNAAERNLANSLTFDSSGFTMPSTNNNANVGSSSSVAWAWDAGSLTASNTDGSITSSVRVNQTAGISIVSYTGTGANATVGHGLTAPKFIIVKDRDAVQDWAVWHTSLSTPTTGFLSLNSTDAASNSAAYWNSTVPTNSVFSLGTAAAVNTSGNDYIAYCFSSVKSFSAISSYTGNGSTTQGVYVHTNFRPAWILIKRRASGSSYSSWAIYDSTRSTFNTTGTSSYNFPLYANLSAAEGKRGNGSDAASGAENIINFFSNGFMALGSGAELNVSGEVYVYIAFATSPFSSNGGLAF